MTDNIIKLVPPEKRAPDADVIAQVEVLLELAKQGDIASFAYVAVGDPAMAPATGSSGPHRNALIAGVATLSADIVWRRIA